MIIIISIISIIVIILTIDIIIIIIVIYHLNTCFYFRVKFERTAGVWEEDYIIIISTYL